MSEPAATYQPDPTPGRQRVIDEVLFDLDASAPLDHRVMRDLIARAEFGLEKYQTYLMTHNGRDALMDAYQEALDLIMYLKQAHLEGVGKDRQRNGLAYHQAIDIARHLATEIEERNQ